MEIFVSEVPTLLESMGTDTAANRPLAFLSPANSGRVPAFALHPALTSCVVCLAQALRTRR